ncbi:MAG: alpha/beta hydrolase family protein [Promethearchaeota archaeon]
MSGKSQRYPVESLLSARRLLAPELVNDRIYFMSDMSGMFSLYAMKREGSIPESLLPPGLALQNPHLMAGGNFVVVPKISKVLVMIDENGNENYQPCFVPITGGLPEPIFGDKYQGQKLMLVEYDKKTGTAYFNIDDRKTPDVETIQVNLATLEVKSLGKSIYGNYPIGHNSSHRLVILADGYTANDITLYIWHYGDKERSLLFGTPIEKRKEGEKYPLLGIGECHFIRKDKALVFTTTLHNDLGGVGFLDLKNPKEILPVSISGLKHKGVGELGWMRHIHGDTYILCYNIDGCTWLYQAKLDESKTPPKLRITHTLIGEAPLDGGVELGVNESVDESKTPAKIEYVVAYTTATSPSQIYRINPDSKTQRHVQLSMERVLGIDKRFLSAGEDASYATFDELRISARLYLPAKALNYKGPFPLVLYVHGGPQGQERPNFTWFSMPLIQFLTLNGFAVFVPNVRGSTGYGQTFMKMVDHDWGGGDAKDHIAGLKVLEKDKRIDSSRRAVVGRSYGGYMTLWLASNYPDFWKASCDMFGPYNLFSFLDRLPETWKTYFYLAIGHPEKDKDFLTERSPMTYFKQMNKPMLVIQGRNDPRVTEPESTDVVEQIRKQGVEVEYLVFDDEGHGVEKFKNQVICYNRIVDFFKKHLMG